MNAFPTNLCKFRAARNDDAAWLDAHLPADRMRGASFVGERDGARVAAFAVAPPIERYEPQGLALAMHVEASPQAADVARQIVTLARKMADAKQLGPLISWPFPIEGSPSERGPKSLGFEAFDHIVTWELDTESAKQQLLAWLEPAKHFSPDDPAWRAVDVPLRDANVDDVLALYESRLAQLGPARERMAARLRGEGDGAFDLVRSRVHTLDGRTLGVVLMEFTPALTTIRARIVADGLGDGVFGVRQLADVCLAAPIPPGNRLRFETHDRHRQTARLAKRLGAIAIETRVKMRLGID